MATLRYGCRSRALGGFAALTIFWASGLAAQTGSIAGRVIDAQSGQTLPAAQVFIGDLDIGVLTQQNGSYILLNVPAGSHTVTVQRIGYGETQETVAVTPGETAVLDFRITEQALQLDEIIITGTPGGTQRRAIGNTVTSVGVSDVVQDVAVASMQDLLSARTPGLRFNVLDGNVGTSAPITLRGVGSFDQGRNQPLLYVDGVRVNNTAESGPDIADGRQASVLDDFNPEDIESIEIITGPAAASLYGTEASAGVIQIITKRGREGSPQFNVSIRQGVNYVANPAEKLGTMWTCAARPAPGGGVNGPCQDRSELVPYNMYDDGNQYIRDGYFGWPTENLFQNGHSQSYNVDVRGGTQAISYFLSANYDDEEGFVWFNTDETFRLRGNVGVVFDEHFSLDVSTGYVDGFTRFESATPGDGGIWQDLLWSNGYYLDRVNAFGSPANCTVSGCGPSPRLGGFQEHLPTDVAENEASRDYSRFTGSATLNFRTGDFDFGNMTASITQRAVVGVDKGWDENRIMHPLEDGLVPQSLIDYCAARSRPASCVPANWGSVYSETANGEMQYERPIQTNLSFDYSLTANLDVNDTWGFATSFGAQYYVDEENFFANHGTGFASPLSTTVNQLSQTQTSIEYRLVQNKSLGFYVQEEISWNDRLFLTGALRFDDNSTFGVDAPAQKYPKISGTWVVSEESFWGFDAINSLRVRGAWGKAGRQPSSTSGQDIYVGIPGPGGSSGIRPQSPGNPAIEPEVSTELELGFDIAVLDDRVSGEFTHYWRKDEQALLELAVLSSTGFPGSVDANLGRIDNWGWEALLSTRLYESDALTFDLDLSGDYTNNEIKDLGDYPGTTSIRVGYPYPNQIEGDRVVSAQFDPTALPDGNFTNAFGRVITAMCDSGVSLAPAGAANPEQYGVMPGGAPANCSTIPDRNIFAGPAFATHSFSVAPRIGLLSNQLQVFALAEGQYGRVGEDDGHLWGHNYNNSAVSRSEDDAFWVASNRVNGTGDTWTQSYFDADFWKLREVGARYTLPQSFVQQTGAERASLAFSARNLWTIWVAQKEIYDLPVTDPEFGNPAAIDGGGNFRAQPPGVSLNVTLRVTF
jgi:TonB-dependent SusC/RagA subfamily outer membrane receptor